MEGFDTMAMPPYLASPLSLGNLQGDYINALPGLELPDHRSNFDSETFVRFVSCPALPPKGLECGSVKRGRWIVSTNPSSR